VAPPSTISVAPLTYADANLGLQLWLEHHDVDQHPGPPQAALNLGTTSAALNPLTVRACRRRPSKHSACPFLARLRKQEK